ncbi:hypothetical protein BDV93DRAFT_505619 [Ceratobasidium sp. AG-I]|nr:hypothetical protein BDV93DRAFT_505619 [Ceratobasidium sp. AG-I]
MIYNTIVLCYMLLACFPWIENPELAAVQLILEHVSTFDVKLGRVVLTREGYNRAQELLPQLLVLAARNNLACPADLTPSFMNIFVIIQTIVDPLVKNLTPEERTAVYATKSPTRPPPS